LEALVAIWVWILIAVAVAVIVVVVVAMLIAQRKRRTSSLRQRFGPEYERTMQQQSGRRAAERDLRNRQKQRARLEIRPLPEAARAHYAEEWRAVQERFVDQPSSAVLAADALVRRVMGDEGYPVEDFNAQSDLVSVDHPRVVENYRRAHDVYERTQKQQASTEDMRTALLRYRSLFDELLAAGSTEPDGRAPAPGRRAATQEQQQPGQHEGDRR
jgi:hypothetical protein